MSNNNNQNTVLEPHLQEPGGGRSNSGSGSRYPNPFFDLSQQYTPRTVKELFKWCTYFFYTDPLINSALTKISRYPITPLILEDENIKVKESWEYMFNDVLKMEDTLMDINLDLNAYGNCFASISYPFNRYLVCSDCKHAEDVKNLAWNWVNYSFAFKCLKCKTQQMADPEKPHTIKDVPYKSRDRIKIVRWNPENMGLRYNEVTAETFYFYNVSRQVRAQVQSGEKEVIEMLPLLFLTAIKKQRLIRMSTRNLFHVKRPTLAEKDMGWGKPLIQPVLRDLYYMATLRRAQESIANQHIVPFDFLFPQPNAQMDPFTHSDLGSWRQKVQEAIQNQRRDPNYKAIMPVPIGFGRIGGDGKSLLLTPELEFLSKKIVGGMGIPLEFVFGGLNWTGSSITLRTLQNDFKHNQTQLLEFTRWIKNKIRLFLDIPDIDRIRFMDFKMADDVQKIQQFMNLNSQRKVSDETLLTEIGLNYEKETKKIIQETQVQNEMQDLMARAQAKTAGESQIISYNYQQRLQEMQMDDQKKMHEQHPEMMGPTPGEQQEQEQEQGFAQSEAQGEEAKAQQIQSMNQTPQGPAAQGGATRGQPSAGGQPAAGGEGGGQGADLDVNQTAQNWANKLLKMDPPQAQQMLVQVRQQMPAFAKLVEDNLNKMKAGEEMGGAGDTNAAGETGAAQKSQGGVNMTPMPEQRAPTRKGGP